MSDDIYEMIMEYLTPKRMASVGNIANAVDSTSAEIIPYIQELEAQDKIRLATSGCSSDCSSCSSCGPENKAAPSVTERTIAISLQKS